MYTTSFQITVYFDWATSSVPTDLSLLRQILGQAEEIVCPLPCLTRFSVPTVSPSNNCHLIRSYCIFVPSTICHCFCKMADLIWLFCSSIAQNKMRVMKISLLPILVTSNWRAYNPCCEVSVYITKSLWHAHQAGFEDWALAFLNEVLFMTFFQESYDAYKADKVISLDGWLTQTWYC